MSTVRFDPCSDGRIHQPAALRTSVTTNAMPKGMLLLTPCPLPIGN